MAREAGRRSGRTQTQDLLISMELLHRSSSAGGSRHDSDDARAQAQAHVQAHPQVEPHQQPQQWHQHQQQRHKTREQDASGASEGDMNGERHATGRRLNMSVEYYTTELNPAHSNPHPHSPITSAPGTTTRAGGSHFKFPPTPGSTSGAGHRTTRYATNSKVKKGHKFSSPRPSPQRVRLASLLLCVRATVAERIACGFGCGCGFGCVGGGGG